MIVGVRRGLLATFVMLAFAGSAAAADKRVFFYPVKSARASDLARLIALTYGVAEPAAPDAGSGAKVEKAERDPLLSGSSANPAEPSGSPAKRPKGPGEYHVALPGQALGGEGTVNVVGSDATNTLAVYATEAEFKALVPTIAGYDKSLVQVFIEAAILEVSLNDNTQYGLQYFYNAGGGHSLVLSDGKTTTIGQKAPGLSYTFNHGTNLQVILSALSSLTRVQVISSPKVLVQNLETASMGAGSRVPYATKQAIDIVTSSPAITNEIAYRDTGVVLEVTPKVSAGGLVTMEVVEEVSQPSPTTTSKIDSPTFDQRRITSTVTVEDGATVALGGLITEERIKANSGIPVLSRVPVLGPLFRDTGDQRLRTELMVLLTPHVMNSGEDERRVLKELNGQAPGLAPLVDKAGKSGGR